jgi:hypothetical protein
MSTPTRAELCAHLIQLAQEYREFIQLTDSGALEAEERRALLAQRSLTHDQIIALFEQLGIPFVDRDDVRRQALDIAARGSVPLGEGRG